ncbi:MAG: hypothetical protein WBQ50_06040 [Nocardioides sp.]
MRIPPRRLLATALPLALSLSLVGCGQASGPGSADAGGDTAATPSEPGTTRWKDCTVAAFERSDAPVTELAGGQVKLPASGPCAGGLVRLGDAGVSGVDITALDLDSSSLRVVRLDGGDDLVRIDGGRHPRGGFQPHLFTTSGDVEELTVDGQPLIPFVATDGGMAPMTVRCGPGGTVELLRATTSEPPGVVLAWDVEQTTYDVTASVREVGTEQLRDHAADPVLRGDLPALFDPEALFANC